MQGPSWWCAAVLWNKYLEEVGLGLHAVCVQVSQYWENPGEQCCWSTWHEQRGLFSVWAPKAVVHEHWCHTGIGLCFPSLWQMWTASYFGLQCSWDNLHKLMCFMNNFRLINENYFRLFRLFKFPKPYRPKSCYLLIIIMNPLPDSGSNTTQLMDSVFIWHLFLCTQMSGCCPSFFNWNWNNPHVDGDKK